MSEHVGTRPELPPQLGFMSIDAIDKLRDEQSGIMVHVYSPDACQQQIREGIYDYVSQGMTKGGIDPIRQQDLRTDCIQAITEVSAHNMAYDRWSTDPQYHDGVTRISGMQSLTRETQAIAEHYDITDTDTGGGFKLLSRFGKTGNQAPAQPVAVETTTSAEDTRTLDEVEAALGNKRYEFAKVSMDQRRRLIDRQKMQQLRQEVSQAYQEEHATYLGKLIMERGDMVTVEIQGKVESELGKLKEAQDHVLTQNLETTKMGKIAHAVAKTKRRFYAVTALASGVTGFLAKQGAKHAGIQSGLVLTGSAIGVGIGTAAGIAIGTTRAAMKSIGGLRHLQHNKTDQQKRYNQDENKLRKALSSVETNKSKQDYATTAVAALHTIARARIEKDRHSNQRRVGIAMGIGAVAGATGGLIDSDLLEKAAQSDLVRGVTGKLSSFSLPIIGFASGWWTGGTPAPRNWPPTNAAPAARNWPPTPTAAPETPAPSAAPAPATPEPGNAGKLKGPKFGPPMPDGKQRINSVVVQKGESYTQLFRRVAQNRANNTISSDRSFKLFQRMRHIYGDNLFTEQNATYARNDGYPGLSNPGQRVHFKPGARRMFNRLIAK